MVSTEYSEAIVEVLDILQYSDDYIIERIPKKLIEFWERNKSTTYKPNLDHSKPINEMKLKHGELYNAMSLQEIRNKWIQDFKFTWENIQKPSPDELAKEKVALIDNLLKIKDLGVDTSELIEELNASEYFTQKFVKSENDFLNDDDLENDLGVFDNEL